MKPAYLTRGGASEAAIVVGAQAGDLHRWLATELQRDLFRLTGASLPIALDAAPSPGMPLIAVGGPRTNAVTARLVAAGDPFARLAPDGYALRTVDADGRPTVLCGGNDDRGDLYAVYALLEHLGLVFQLTGDVLPVARPDLPVPELELTCEPAYRHRGLMYYDLLMPWAGLAELTGLLDQMAKLRMNRLIFFSYTGAPWVEFACRGEKALIGDLYPRESGYRTIRMNTQTYTAADLPLGAESFGRKRVGSTEFQDCQTPEEAHEVARRLLRAVIAHAHTRGIEVWLAAGDCPGTHPNLARQAQEICYWTTQCGLVVGPGDPVGLEAWEALMTALVDTYPEADRYLVGLAEWTMDATQPGTRAVIDQYAASRPLIPSVTELREMGYDYADPPFNFQDEPLRDAELVLLHYGKELTERLRRSRPAARLGIYLLGRAYMLRAFDAIIDKDVALASMEASICWNRRSRRLPIELFRLPGRETVVVPRLDDGESGFGMQFNATLYANDRVAPQARVCGPAGLVAALGGRLHGVEHNARYLAEACWQPGLTPDAFYDVYARRLFGGQAAPALVESFELLERHEMFIGLEAEGIPEAGAFFLGMGNFTDWTLSKDIGHMGAFRRLRNPMAGPDLPDWRSGDGRRPAWLRESAYRRDRYGAGLGLLRRGLERLTAARPMTAPGAAAALEYLTFRTRLYIGHLETIRLLLGSYLAYDEAFRARHRGDQDAFHRLLADFGTRYSQALGLARETTAALATGSTSGTDRYLLFRYGVLWLRPLEAFAAFVSNVVRFHRGEPYWEKVDWSATEIARLPFENV